MSDKLKLSPWHDGSVKPVHVGMYQRNWYKKNSFYDHPAYYAWWNGEHWKYSCSRFEQALLNINGNIDYSNVEWRGILK